MIYPYPDTLEFEASFLGGILFKPSTFLEVDQPIHPEHFSDSFYGAAWRQILDMYRENHEISAVVLADRMTKYKSENFDPNQAIAELVTSVVTTINVPYYAKLIVEGWQLRQLSEAARLALDDIGGASLGAGDSQRIGSKLSTRSIQISATGFELADLKSLGETALAALDETTPVTSTGFSRLDDALGGGLYRGKLYGLCAAKKAGKTSFLGSVAYQMTKQNVGWCYVALEMGQDQIFHRLAARHMGCNALAFLDAENRRLSWFRKSLEKATGYFEDKDGFFHSKPGLDLDDLISLLARISMSDRCAGVFIDYLQLIRGRPPSMTDTYWMDEVAQALAEAAKRFDLWIVVAAQIGRNGSVYGGDGLGRACDVNLILHRLEPTTGDPIGTPDRAWIEMSDSRYTPVTDVGSGEEPAYWLDQAIGPHFQERGHPDQVA